MNEKHFKPIKSINVSDQVAEQIKKLILNGIVKPGDKVQNETYLN